MSAIKPGQIAIGILAIAAILLLILLAARFRSGIQSARSRLEAINSQIVQTACGEIEYTTHGSGTPILVVHGIFGGHDQGLVMAKGQIGVDFRSIIPSRFGYLGSSMPENASPASQADAFACLLDELGIEKAVILGTSAGGTSAIQFALRHPDRCTGLILVSSNAPGEVEVGLPPRPLANVLFRSDFAFWLMTTAFPSSMHDIMGVPADYEMTPQEQAEMEEVMATLLPVSPRAEGALFDMYVSNPSINKDTPLGEITVPTLVIHAQDDPLADYSNARAMAQAIPNAEMVTIPEGGHPLLGHEEEIRSRIAAFIENVKSGEE